VEAKAMMRICDLANFEGRKRRPARKTRSVIFNQQSTSKNMTNALIKPQAQTPYGAFAKQVNAQRIVGRLLRFNKGDWLVGGRDSQEELKIGTQVVLIMPSLLVGWIKWMNGEKVDYNVGIVAEGFVLPRRNDLDDRDQDQWPLDEITGNPKDPWQRTCQIVMVDRELREVYTFTTNSGGGLRVMADICDDFNLCLMEKGPGCYPLVSLEVGSYQHKDRAIGRVKVPDLKIVEFVSAAKFDAKLAIVAGRQEHGEDNAPEPAERSRLEPPRSLPHDEPPPPDSDYGGGEIDDDIPF
jgi:hypothetical protein